MRRSRYIIIAIILIIVLVGVSIVMQSARVGQLAISAAPGRATVEVTVYPPTGSTQTFKLGGGDTKTLTLPKGAVRVDASADKIKSVDVVEVKGWRATTELTTPSGDQRAVQKLGSNSVECPLASGSKIFSYSCASEGPIFRHVPIDSNRLDPRDPLLGGQTFLSLQPYAGGLFGYEFESSPELIFISVDRQTVTTFAPPGDVGSLLQTERPRLVVSGHPADTHFALVFKEAGRIYIFDNLKDQNPVRLGLDKAIVLNDEKFISGYQLLEKTLLIFIGNNDHYEGETGANEVESDLQSEEYLGEASQTPQHVFEYDLSGKQTRHLELPGGVAATSGVLKLAGDYYAMHTNMGVDLYRYQDDRLAFVYNMRDVTDILPTKNQTYFVVNGTLYTLEPSTPAKLLSLHSTFSSPALTVSTLTNTGNGLIFTAFSNRTEEQATLDIFRLLDNEQTTLPFEEVFSYDKLASVITGYDYDDKQIIFYMRVAGSGGGSYDQLLKGMKDKLKELNMDVGGRAVTIGPLN